MRKNGFTLIELLIVVAIIGILASIMVPVLSKARENARKASCTNNLKQIGIGLRLYANEHSDSFPTDNNGKSKESLSLLYNSYIGIREIFSCPSNSTNTTGLTSQTDFEDGSAQGVSFNCSYGYDPTKDLTINPGVAIASDIPASTGEIGPNHNNRLHNVLYIDGHVNWNGTITAGISGDDFFDENIFRNTSGETSTPSTGTDSVIRMD